MNAKIMITGISEAEQAAREILAHIEQIKEIQRNTSWSSSGIRVELTEKEKTSPAEATAEEVAEIIAEKLQHQLSSSHIPEA